MAKRRISRPKIREVLRLKRQHNFSNRKIANSCSISHTTVREYFTRAKLAGLSWPFMHSLMTGSGKPAVPLADSP